jgi:hypothetical protein
METVTVWQAEVQDGNIVGVGGKRGAAFGAQADEIDSESGLLEWRSKDLSDARLIFNDKKPHGSVPVGQTATSVDQDERFEFKAVLSRRRLPSRSIAAFSRGKVSLKTALKNGSSVRLNAGAAQGRSTARIRCLNLGFAQ